MKVLKFTIPHVCESCVAIIETHISGKGENMAKHKIGKLCIFTHYLGKRVKYAAIEFVDAVSEVEWKRNIAHTN